MDNNAAAGAGGNREFLGLRSAAVCIVLGDVAYRPERFRAPLRSVFVRGVYAHGLSPTEIPRSGRKWSRLQESPRVRACPGKPPEITLLNKYDTSIPVRLIEWGNSSVRLSSRARFRSPERPQKSQASTDKSGAHLNIPEDEKIFGGDIFGRDTANTDEYLRRGWGEARLTSCRAQENHCGYPGITP